MTCCIAASASKAQGPLSADFAFLVCFFSETIVFDAPYFIQADGGLVASPITVVEIALKSKQSIILGTNFDVVRFWYVETIKGVSCV